MEVDQSRIGEILGKEMSRGFLGTYEEHARNIITQHAHSI